MHCATCMQHFTNVEKATTQYKPEIDEGKIKNHKNLSNENGGYFMHGDLLKTKYSLQRMNVVLFLTLVVISLIKIRKI